jgi:TP901 family phage tail tape measure protein
MSTLTSSLIVRLIDQVTGPARGIEDSLRRITRAGSASGTAPSWADNMAVAQARVGAAIERNNAALSVARMGLIDAVAGYYVLDRTVGRAVRTSANFEEAMNGVAVVSRASAEQLAAMRQQAMELGRTTTFTASQVADGMGFLAMAGFDAEQVMGAMPQTLALAAAGNMDLGRSADIVSNILTGYGLQVSDLTRVSDILVGTFTRTNTNLEQLGTAFTYAGPLAAAAGMDFAETAAILGRMGDAGFQGSLGGTALRGAIVRLLAPTSGAQAAMEALDVSVGDLVADGEDLDESLAASARAMEQIGLQVTDAEGRMLPFVEIMRQLEGHADDAGLMTQLFGQRAGPAMTSLLRQGARSVEALTAELSTLDGETQRVADVRMAGFNGQMRAFQSAVEGVQIAIGTALLPTLTQLVREFTRLMLPVTSFIEANPELTKAVIGTTAALIGLRVAAAGLTFIGLLGKGGALYMLAGGLRAITALGTPVAGFFATLQLRALLASRATGQMPGILARIGDAIAVLVRSIPGFGMLSAGITALGAAVGGLSAPALAAIGAAVGAIASAGVVIWRYWDRISAVFAGVGRALGERLQPYLEAARPILEWFAPLGQLIADAWGGLANIFSSLGAAISAFFTQETLTDEEKAAFEQKGYEFAQAFIAPFFDIVDWFAGLPGRIIDAVGSIDLSSIITWPEIPAPIRRLLGMEEADPAAPAPLRSAADAAATLDAAREVARIRAAAATEAQRSGVGPEALAPFRQAVAEAEAELDRMTAGLPDAVRADLDAYVAAIAQGGVAAQQEADRLGTEIINALAVTVTPVVDTSSIDSAAAAVGRLNAALNPTAPAPLRSAADAAATLDAAREVARIRAAAATEAQRSGVGPEALAPFRQAVAEAEAELDRMTEGLPDAVRADLDAYVAAIAQGGVAAQQEADRLGTEIINALAVTVTPVVDTSSIDSAAAAVGRLNAALDRVGTPRLAADSPRYPSRGINPRPRSGGRATGGPVWPSGSFLVGEREPELFTPHTAGRITPLSDLDQRVETLFARMGSASRTPAPVTVSFGDIVVNGVSDPAEAARQVRAMLDREIATMLRAINADMGVRS